MSCTVSSLPHMDAEGLKCFCENISRAKCYLEYGCGGSTAYAANVAKVTSIIAVDTSRQWIESVVSVLSSAQENIFIEHCDLGETGDWGVPKTTEKYRNFWRYVTTPWCTAKQNNLTPDLVLIDGRFRVASFLFSLLSAREGTIILFDDYFDRPHYFVVEEFCEVDSRKGRMAVFKAASSFSQVNLATKLMAYSVDWS